MTKGLLIFPGVLFHELSHLTMCFLLSVKVRGFKLSIRNLSGSVAHIVPKSLLKSLSIAVAPGIFSVTAAYIILTSPFWLIFRLYLSFVVLYASLPSKEDTGFSRHHPVYKKILSFPLFLVFRIFYLFSLNNALRTFYALLVIVIILI